MNHPGSVLDGLMKTIEHRKREPSDRSYTAQLMAGGIPTIGAKIIEEASELVEAADEEGDGSREHLVHEAADLVYHLFVLLGFRNVSLSDLESELAGRVGISGLDEKATRSGGPNSTDAGPT